MSSYNSSRCNTQNDLLMKSGFLQEQGLSVPHDAYNKRRVQDFFAIVDWFVTNIPKVLYCV
jgi:hypothetical protein